MRRHYIEFIKKIGVISIIVLCLASSISTAQQTKLKFRRITVDNGLPQNVVMSILQDRKGYMWFGTFSGVTRFDGIHFETYKNNPKDNHTLSNNRVLKVFQDHDGFIWVGTSDGLNCYDPLTNSFIRYQFKGLNAIKNVYDLVEDARGNIWAGTDYGLFYIAAKNKKKGLFLPGKIVNSPIQSLYVDDKQRLWIGNNDKLQIYDLKNSVFVKLANHLPIHSTLFNSVVQRIVQDHDQTYWIATENAGLFAYDAKFGRCKQYTKNEGLLSNTVRGITEAGQNLFYIATREGLNVLNKKTGQLGSSVHDPNDETSIGHISIRCITKDRENNIWLGTFNGGLYISSQQSGNFGHVKVGTRLGAGLSSGIVNAVFQDTDRSFWVGTDDGALNHLDSNFLANDIINNNIDVVSGKPGSIKAIAQHPDKNKFWVGTGSGLKIFDKRQKVFIDLDMKAKSLRPATLQSFVLLKDKKGIWIGTNVLGLYYLDDKMIRSSNAIFSSIGLGNLQNITALFDDGEHLWIGTKVSGLHRLNKKTHQLKTFTSNPKFDHTLTNNAILSIYKDKSRRLWIGTDGGGLNYFSSTDDKFYTIDESLGLADNSIQQILQDSAGHIWVSTNKGLCRIQFNTFTLPFSVQKIKISNYVVADGIQSNQFTTSSLIAKNNTLIFGGINGLTVFDPSRILSNLTKPPIVLTDFLIFDKSVDFKDPKSPLRQPIDETSEIVLPYDKAYFSIKFAALSYVNPLKNRFAFTLKGLSNDRWQYTREPVATYTNLEPGNYVFTVKAANNDGIWNDTPRTLRIVILPPWYRTLYAYLLYTALGIGAIYAFIKYSKRTARLQAQLEYEQKVHLKDQLLAKDKLNFFMNVSHEIKTPLTMILAPIERLIKVNVSNKQVIQQLKLLQNNGNRLFRLVNQLLELQKFETGNVNLHAGQHELIAFLNELIQAFKELANQKNIHLSLHTNLPNLFLWFDEDKMEKIIFNLLSNAIKFTHEFGKIVISVKPVAAPQETESIEIAVSDNGRGMDEKQIANLFDEFPHDESYYSQTGSTGLGLAYTKKLVELHHGQLTVESLPETKAETGSTTFTVILPLGNSHLGINEMIDNKRSGQMPDSMVAKHPDLEEKFLLRKAAIMKNEARKKLNLLIVEDNLELLIFLKSGFEKDFIIDTASNGIEGLKIAKKVIPDIIISDIMMPGMNGIKLSKILKSEESTSHIPIILLTARSQQIFQAEGLNTGADDYLNKPFNFDILEIRVWNLLENRQKMRLKFQRAIMLEPRQIQIPETDELFINRLITYIEENVDNVDLSVEDLNKKFSMSRSTFTKKLKALTNQTGVEFIRNIRLKYAAALLSSGKFTVNEVVFKVGFEDVNYFRKCFKAQFGYPPSQQSPK